jgi:hypothetical protein
MATENLSITGLWHGQFSYPRGLPPEFFTATLLDEPGWLSGATTETLKGVTICASLLGRRDGHSVTFTKTYQGERRRHAVLYAGTLNGDRTEIEGIWTVPRSWSGRFLMIRQSRVVQKRRRLVAAPV